MAPECATSSNLTNRSKPSSISGRPVMFAATLQTVVKRVGRCVAERPHDERGVYLSVGARASGG